MHRLLEIEIIHSQRIIQFGFILTPVYRVTTASISILDKNGEKHIEENKDYMALTVLGNINYLVL